MLLLRALSGFGWGGGGPAPVWAGSRARSGPAAPCWFRVCFLSRVLRLVVVFFYVFVLLLLNLVFADEEAQNEEEEEEIVHAPPKRRRGVSLTMMSRIRNKRIGALLHFLSNVMW